jgi:LAO/AO transport system kinase
MSEGSLAARVVGGDARAAARACRLVDERGPGYLELLCELYPHAQNAWFVGVTGAPGVGKSSLVDRLVQHTRARGERVAVVAIDPTSPFSGGAILGDRIRMQRHFADPEVFIRSLATRGALGGLSRSASAVARVLGAWGAEVVLIETVGVGQDELEIMRLAHSTLVVLAPGAGDDVQAAKAGLLECADVFAVNKADLPGADATVGQLRAMLALAGVTRLGEASPPGHGQASGHGPGVHPPPAAAAADSWQVPVCSCVATRDQGIDALYAELERHHAWLRDTEPGRARRSQRLGEEFFGLMRDALVDAALARHAGLIDQALSDVQAGSVDPYSASREVARRIAGA